MTIENFVDVDQSWNVKFEKPLAVALEEGVEDQKCFNYLLEVGGDCYVGFTTQNPNERLGQHIESAKNGSLQKVHVALRRFGFLNEFSIIGEYKNEVLGLVAEITNIKKYNAALNASIGGEGNFYKVVEKKNSLNEDVFFVQSKTLMEESIAAVKSIQSHAMLFWKEYGEDLEQNRIDRDIWRHLIQMDIMEPLKQIIKKTHIENRYGVFYEDGYELNETEKNELFKVRDEFNKNFHYSYQKYYTITDLFNDDWPKCIRSEEHLSIFKTIINEAKKTLKNKNKIKQLSIKLLLQNNGITLAGTSYLLGPSVPKSCERYFYVNDPPLHSDKDFIKSKYDEVFREGIRLGAFKIGDALSVNMYHWWTTRYYLMFIDDKGEIITKITKR